VATTTQIVARKESKGRLTGAALQPSPLQRGAVAGEEHIAVFLLDFEADVELVAGG
jgi:hypothetical protein